MQLHQWSSSLIQACHIYKHGHGDSTAELETETRVPEPPPYIKIIPIILPPLNSYLSLMVWDLCPQESTKTEFEMYK